MTDRTSYTPDELEACRDAADGLLAAWQANDIEDETLENLVFSQAVVALDAWFAHRSPEVEGEDGNPLNEVRLLADSIIANDGVLRVPDHVRWVPGRTVLRLAAGDEVVVTADTYERLVSAYLAAIAERFVTRPG